MTVSKMKSGRWRAQVWAADKNAWIPVADVIGGERSFRTKRDAQRAKERARDTLTSGADRTITVGEFHERWITDRLFARPSESTNRHYAERTRSFALAHRDVPMGLISDLTVAAWIRDGRNTGTVPALRAMFNDAMSAKAGRVVDRNPFANLGLAKTKGNKHRTPPSEQQAWELIGLARELTIPSFADYLEVACFTALRPGELDGLVMDDIDTENMEIHVRRQYNAKLGKFTLPKHRHAHTVTLTPIVRDCLARRKTTVADPVLVRTGSREVADFIGDWCFPTLRGHHFTPSSRNHHWNRVRAAAGLGNVTLYMATRHFAGSHMLNTLGLPPHVIAEQLGHRDGGKLVVDLYGHPDARVARRRIREAFEEHGQVRPLRVVNRTETA